ncbi:MAG: ribbon-helix-helix domain-containing protein [Candidatus Tectomicrobia bacterium]|nr:ribbon-helix-helix domain-containing protein [Candidatus Tectomicrobia bacterium]
MKINLSLDETVIKAVKHRAVEEGRSVSSLIEEWLRFHLGLPAHPKQRTKSPQSPAAPALPAETQTWLDADLSRLGEVEPYDWGDADPTRLGEPVSYEPKKGWIVGNEGRHDPSR